MITPLYSVLTNVMRALDGMRINCLERKSTSLFLIAFIALSACSDKRIKSSNEDDVQYRMVQDTREAPDDIQPETLLRYTPPEYPQALRDGGIEGYAFVEYDITTSGKTENIEIIESDPPDTFEQVTVESIKTWRYSPASKDGKLYRTNSVRQFIKYCIGGEDTPPESHSHPVCKDDALSKKIMRQH